MKMKNRVLAVLALALLMINILPVRVAEAAETSDGVYYPDIYEIDWGEYEEAVMTALENGKYFVVVYDGTNYTYMVSSYAEIAGCTSGITKTYSMGMVDCTPFVYNPNSGAVSVYPANYSVSLGVRATNVVGTSYDYRLNGNGSSNSDLTNARALNLTYPAPEPVVQYSPDAPYLKNVVFSNVNNFLLDGNTDFSQSIFRYTFELGNADIDCVSRKTQISGYVYLPSKELIDKAKNAYLGGRASLDEYYSIYSCEYYPSWLKSLDLGDGSTYKRWYFKTEFDCTDSAVLRLSHQDIFELVEQVNGIDLKEYYGISDVAYIDHILKGYMWIQRLDGIVYTTYSDGIKYGNMTSFVCSMYLKDPVVSVGNSDPLFYGPPIGVVGPMLPDEEVYKSIEQAYKEALDEANKKYEENLNLDMDSDNVFDLFGSLSDGIRGLSGSFRNIAVAVGNVFAFFPEEITSILFAGLVACIVIAVYKALRG